MKSIAISRREIRKARSDRAIKSAGFAHAGVRRSADDRRPVASRMGFADDHRGRTRDGAMTDPNTTKADPNELKRTHPFRVYPARDATATVTATATATATATRDFIARVDGGTTTRGSTTREATRIAGSLRSRDRGIAGERGVERRDAGIHRGFIARRAGDRSRTRARR